DEQLSVIGQYALNFSADVSGLCYDVSNNCLWIVSDQSRLLAKCRRDGQLIKSYPLQIEKAEGVAFNSANSVIYIVSDEEEKLFVYSIG
ncbi:MAG: hypothetical protein GF307_11830, partial [candidate division Zixibacteria bacterium]|nr:hypothetical protein [candidate division Zixibacteria bacterium]